MSTSVSSADAQEDGRDETSTERGDRNWTEILQELRVIQTGTQILTGFLLTLAFQQRFSDLDSYQVTVYLALVSAAVLATALAVAPVSLHRALFGKKAKPELVTASDRLLKVTLFVVSLTIAGTAMLIFDVVAGRTAGVVAGSTAAFLAIALWLVFPTIVRRRLSND